MERKIILKDDIIKVLKKIGVCSEQAIRVYTS